MVDLQEREPPDRRPPSEARRVDATGPGTSLLAGLDTSLRKAQATEEAGGRWEESQGTQEVSESLPAPSLGTDPVAEATDPEGGKASEGRPRDCIASPEPPGTTLDFRTAPDDARPGCGEAESEMQGTSAPAPAQQLPAKAVASSSSEREPPERPSTPPIAESQRSPRIPDCEAVVCAAAREPEEAVLAADPGSRIQDLSEDDLHSGLFQWAEDSAVASLGTLCCLPSSPPIPHLDTHERAFSK